MLSDWLVTIEARMARGTSFDEIEDTINAEAHLSENQKCALWLYAWSCQSQAEQRATALVYAQL